jgi:Ca-activated chloride channel family protein
VNFLWPALLYGLLLLPLMVAGYVWLLRRRSRLSVTFPTLEIVAAAVDTRHRVRRHLPAAFFLLTFLAIITAVARPVISMPVPSDRAAMVLAIDVSGSMLSQDVDPSRLEAAKAAAKEFVGTLPHRLRVGLVTFAGYAVLAVPPTTDHERVLEAIDAITVRHRTAIGDGLIEAVAALPERVRPRPDGTLPPMPIPLPPPGIVVLLSDGQNNAGVDPLAAAEVARRERVTVYTVGIGVPLTPATRWILGGPLDEETLRAVAGRTGGEYYHPKSGRELRDVYKKLARSVGWERRPVEVTSLAAGAGTLMFLTAIGLGAGLHPLGR